MIVALTLPACTWMRPGYDLPAVTLESFRALPSEGALPEFEIGLGIINPNREPLEVVVSSPEALDYEFKAKLDMGAFHRAIRIRESGQFRFGQDIREP